MMGQRQEHQSGLVLGLVLGGLLGGLLGLLLAPDSGEKSRKKGMEGIRDLSSKIHEDLDNPYGMTRTVLDKTRFKFQQGLDHLKKQAEARKQALAKNKEYDLDDAMVERPPASVVSEEDLIHDDPNEAGVQ
ncbi:MAG: YtxH domain-containing protein [Vampirovibrionales bacterium]